MANTYNKYQLKRTSVSGRTPNTTNSSNSSFLDTAELALNLTDKKMFSSNGTALFEVGANLSSLHVTGNTVLDGAIITTGANVSGNAYVTDTLFGNNVILTGNLTVSGTTTYINTVNMTVGDNIITLNADLANTVAPTENSGIEVNRGSSANVQFVWDETNDRWTTNTQPMYVGGALAAGNTTISGTANVSGNVALGQNLDVTGNNTFRANTTFIGVNKNYAIWAGQTGTPVPDDRLNFKSVTGFARYWFDSASASGGTGFSIAEAGTERAYMGTGANTFGFVTYVPYNLSFRSANGTAETTMMLLDTNTMYVGIGTTTPSSKLHVVGTANITGNVGIGGTLTVPTINTNTFGISNSSFVLNTSVTGWHYNGNQLSIAAKETASTGLFFSTDGTKAYVVGTTSDAVHQYNLSTPYNISTGVFANSFSIITQDTTSGGLFFKPDGTKMYMAGQTGDAAYQYTLATPWDISTATYDSVSLSIITQDTSIGDIFFSPDGVYLYMLGYANDFVSQYTLSTPWLLSSATYTRNFSVVTVESTGTGLSFSADGLTMFTTGQGLNFINKYTLTVAWDVSTAVYVDRLSINGYEAGVTGLYYNGSVNKAWTVGSITDAILEFDTTDTSALKIAANTLFVTGAIQTANNLAVEGSFHLNGAAKLEGNLIVDGSATIGGTLTGSSTLSLTGSTTSTTSLGTAATTGTTTIGGTTQTGTITVGQSTGNQAVNIATGATIAANLKTINIGTGGVSGSFTNVIIGSSVSGANNQLTIYANTAAFNGNVTISSTANVATAINVGANVSVNTTVLFIGNTTVNTKITSTNYMFGGGDTQGIGFYDSFANYFIAMKSQGAAQAGRLDATSDYNMYFQMNGGTNRGFVFRGNGNASNGAVAQIDSTGNFYTLGSHYIGNTTTNTIISTSLISIGNSTVNTQISAGNVFLNGSLLTVGNTTVNTSISNGTANVSTLLNVGANVNLNTTQLNIGNTTVNAVLNSTSLVIANSANVTTNGHEFIMPAATGQFKITRDGFGVTQGFNIQTSASGNFIYSNSTNTNSKSMIMDVVAGGNTTADTSFYVRIEGNNRLKANSTVFTISTAANVLLPFAVTNTAALGNTTITGFANVSSTLNVVGAATVNGALTVNNTAAVGNTTITGTLGTGNTTVTGDLTVTGNTTANNIRTQGSVQIDGNLTVSGNTITIGVTNLAVSDNIIYLNEPETATITSATSNATSFIYTANNGFNVGQVVTVSGMTPTGYNVTSNTITFANATTFAVANTVAGPGAYVSGGTATARVDTNPDIGFAANYNDGTYRHAGFFRDATDGVFKVFDQYLPEPSGAFIDTANASFRIADFQANNTTLSGNTYLGGVSGSESLRVAVQVGANRPLVIQGGVSGSLGARLGVSSEALDYYTTGGFSHFFSTNGPRSAIQLEVAPTSSAVNWLKVTGAPTGSNPYFLATGSDTDIGIVQSTKGAGAFAVWTNGGTAQQFRVAHTASAVNYVQVTGAATGARPSVTAAGSDTNIDLALYSKGTGGIAHIASNALQMYVSATASAVNYIQVSGAATTGAPYILATGTDTDVPFVLSSKGAGTIIFKTAGLAPTQFAVSHTASAVNYVQVTGAATGLPPTISAQGSDAAIDLTVNTKSTGVMRLQTGGLNVLRLRPATSAVNYFDVYQSATNKTPYIQSIGSDTNVPFTILTQGTGAIDLAAGSSGVNISNGGTVTALTRTSGGSAYTSIPSLVISAPTTAGGVQATANPIMQASVPPSVTAGGTGYTVGDTLTVVGGTFITAVSLTVATVSAGVITGVTLAGTGSYTALPSYPASVTGGTGSGATFTFTTWSLSTSVATITNAGSGYVEQPTVSFSGGGGGSGAAAYATVGSIPTLKTIGSALSFSTPSSEVFRIIDANPTAQNFLTLESSGGGSILRGAGASANPAIGYVTKGTGNHYFSTNNSASTVQFNVAHTASAVNYVQATGAATGNAPVLSAQGSDTNINFAYSSKGTGAHDFYTAGATYSRQFRVAHTASAVNYIQATGAATGSAPTLSAQGTDTDIGFTVNSKGAGTVNAQVNGTTKLSVGNAALNVTGNTYLFLGSFNGEGGELVFANTTGGTGPIIDVDGGNQLRISNYSDTTHIRINTGAASPATRIQASANGNVGISNTTPTETLSVTGTVQVTNSTASVLYAAANGNIGIGTVAPVYPLHIQRNANTAVAEIRVDNANTGSSAQARLNLVTASAFSYALHALSDGPTPNYTIGTGQGVTGGITISAANAALTLAANSVVSLKIFANNNIAIGANSTPTEKLRVEGTFSHTGLVPSTGTGIDQIYTATPSITLNTTWQSTGVTSTNLANGSYMVQLFANDIAAGGTANNEYYTGMMSWYSADTNSTVLDEIPLHRAGVSGSNNAIFLATQRTATANTSDLLLMISSAANNSSASTYTIKFRRMI